SAPARAFLNWRAGWKRTAASSWRGPDVRRLRPELIWPELSASPGGPELVHRWEALLDKAPRLRPWVDQMLGRHRLRLQESGAAGFEIERTLWEELAQWLADFEALSGCGLWAFRGSLWSQ